MSRTFEKLESALGCHFTNEGLLRSALTHPSRDRSSDRKPSDYERLEFLGDRVLSLLIAEWLYELYPMASEGELAKRHASLVNRDILAEIAGTLRIEESMILINAEDLRRGRVNILSDALEAIIGALYEDAAHDLAFLRSFMRRFWKDYATASASPPQDPKSALQEWAQARSLPLPEYKVIHQRGPAHAPHYTIEVHVRHEKPVSAEGTSKREAEKKAAEAMPKSLGTGNGE